jgi:hypothetical protein
LNPLQTACRGLYQHVRDDHFHIFPTTTSMDTFLFLSEFKPSSLS